MQATGTVLTGLSISERHPSYHPSYQAQAIRLPVYQAIKLPGTRHACQAARLNLSKYQDNPDSHEMDTPALRGVNNTGGSTQRQLVSYEQFNNSTQTALDRASGNPSRQLLTQPLTAPLPGGMATQLSQEVVENDLQTDPENHLHQPHLNTPIITLSPPHSDE